MSLNSHLPDFRSKEDGVLYIIGNGFDLYHGLPTKYENFHQWLLKEHPEFEHNMNQIYGDDNYDLWKDFEVALGKNKHLYELHNFFGNNSLPREEQRIFAAKKIENTIDKICPYLEEWASTIQYDGIYPVLPLGNGSKYVSFNYTRTLEEIYGIDGEDTVLHIHGMIGKGNIVTGYKYGNVDSPIGNALEEISQVNIKNELERMRKPTAKIFESKRSFFDNLGVINTIIIIGHSLAEVDLPYIKYILNLFPNHIPLKCQYWVHNHEAKDNAEAYIKELCYQNADIEEKLPEEHWEFHIMDSYR